ncbi:RDD family protein [Tardiphaga sp. 709]|uniref:RDD family protein n=1 Tax=Tardiphaga sp. 709 TaxID=3076039 RepID=UPI0028E698D0|nr:RDD family protein [Tardiphaga sp. 709]WNV10513.1 RDD family protein [Tardiphaga sp. 709]
MSDTGPNAGGPNNGSWQGDIWRSAGTRPRTHAFDPYAQPDLFRGVLMRRIVAFLIDLVVLSIPIVLAVIFIAVFGVVTLGLGWALFWLISPATVIWPVVYYGMSLGGPHSATVGMRMMDLQMRTFSGTPGYFVLGAAHAVLFWASVSLLTPLVLVVGLLNGRRQLLHDLVLGTVVVNNSVVRAAYAQPPGRAY